VCVIMIRETNYTLSFLIASDIFSLFHENVFETEPFGMYLRGNTVRCL
jgi:hypothetical protein